MSISFAIAIYVVLWWTVLFAVLPVGLRTQGEEGTVVPGTPESAPMHPRLLRIAVITTIVSTIIYGAVWAGIQYGLIDLAMLFNRKPV
jgi:predicted secreted protein